MQKTIQITFAGKEAASYPIYVKRQSECSVYAAAELNKYLFRATGKAMTVVYEKPDCAHILLDYADEIKDGFSIRFQDGNLLLTGNNVRSVLYAVYELLEKIGWRFFAAQAAYRSIAKGKALYECEKLLAQSDTDIPDTFSTEQEAVIDYRDGFCFAVKDADFCAKMRLNSETWETRELTAQFGGARRFAGSNGHTFKDLLPIEKYGKSHPEFFAEIDGKRKVDGKDWWSAPQWCLTNYDSVPYVLESMRALMKKYPDAEYISVSQNDNKLFCECENCKKSKEKYGGFGTLINYVNKIAEGFEKEYPRVKIHTFVYWGTDDVNDSVRAHKNVMAQWCPSTQCRNHALSDPSCAINRKLYAKLKMLSKVVDEIFIYDYRQCLKYAMLTLTDLFTLRESMRAYAESNVKGIFAEMCIHALKQPTMEELRAYLFGKLTWNPYMSDEEYNRHIDEFLEGYYGKGWRHIREYLEKWCALDPKMHYTSFQGVIITDDLKYARDEKGDIRFADFMPKEKVKDFCALLNGELDKAKELAEGGEIERIEIIRSSLIWYELFHTMKDVMQGDDEEKKAEMTKRCRDLCSRMREHMMKYTIFIGMSNITYMYDDFSMPVSDWNYQGNIAGDGLNI